MGWKLLHRTECRSSCNRSDKMIDGSDFSQTWGPYNTDRVFSKSLQEEGLWWKTVLKPTPWIYYRAPVVITVQTNNPPKQQKIVKRHFWFLLVWRLLREESGVGNLGGLEVEPFDTQDFFSGKVLLDLWALSSNEILQFGASAFPSFHLKGLGP